MKKIPALTVRKKFGAILDEVVKDNETIVITRANEPLVVMEPYASYQARTDEETQRKQRSDASRRIDEWAKKNAKRLRKGPDAVTLIRRFRGSI